MTRILSWLTVLIGLSAPFAAAHATPYDCGAANPRRVREIFENSNYARGNNPEHRPLKAALPTIIKHPDGTCTAKFGVLDWASNQPAGELNLDLVVVYFACHGTDLHHQVPATDPDACAWLNLRNYPEV